MVNTGLYNSGGCNGTGSHYGVPSDNFPATFPDSGSFTAPLYACSVKGAKPSSYMTWFQAAMACELAGKRLCSNHEWQVAAQGTPDDTVSCNLGTKLKEAAGARAKCASTWGAQDMVGNAWEWAAEWRHAGKVDVNFKSATGATPWNSGYGDGWDGTWNLNGQAAGSNGYKAGLPAALARGGGWANPTAAGVYALASNLAPSYRSSTTGARCCRNRRLP